MHTVTAAATRVKGPNCPFTFGAARCLQALTKTALGQVTLFPVYSATFFTYMGLLEGLSPRCVAAAECPPSLVNAAEAHCRCKSFFVQRPSPLQNSAGT